MGIDIREIKGTASIELKDYIELVEFADKRDQELRVFVKGFLKVNGAESNYTLMSIDRILTDMDITLSYNNHILGKGKNYISI